MNPNIVAVVVFVLAVLTACSSTKPSPATLMVKNQDVKVPAALAGSWACESEYSERSKSMKVTAQQLIGRDGKFQVVGGVDFLVDKYDFSIAMNIEGKIQMIDGRYLVKVDQSISLPTEVKVDGPTAIYLNSSLDKEYPTFESGSYEIDDEYLTMVSDRLGIESTCISWDAWEKMCAQENNPDCGVRQNQTEFDQTHQQFLEKQLVLKSFFDN